MYLNEDNLEDLKLSMVPDNDKYHNAVNKLSTTQENYNKQKKNVLLVRRQARSCVVKGVIGGIYMTVLMLKLIHWNKYRVFKVEKMFLLNINQ